MRDDLKYLCIILILAGSLSLIAIGTNGLEFIQEDLEFRLDGKIFKLTGDYWFCNNTDKDITQQLFFPIPADSLNAPAEKAKLKLIKPLPGQKVKLLSVGKQGFWFEVSLPAKTIAICQISYRQKLYGKSAKYVLMSTHSWGKPLEYAKYTLITPSALQVTNLSLSEPEVHLQKGKRYYRWEYLNFLPQADFTVEFPAD